MLLWWKQSERDHLKPILIIACRIEAMDVQFVSLERGGAGEQVSCAGGRFQQRGSTGSLSHASGEPFSQLQVQQNVSPHKWAPLKSCIYESEAPWDLSTESIFYPAPLIWHAVQSVAISSVSPEMDRHPVFLRK